MQVRPIKPMNRETDHAAGTVRSLHTLLNRWQAKIATQKGAPLGEHPPHYTGPDLPLTALVDHTADVIPGACFVARVRTTSDGHPYIPTALAQGATLIIGERPLSELEIDLPPGAVYLQTTDSSAALAWLAAAWYDFPSEQLTVIGVTGTNGKTSVIEMLYMLLRTAGLQTGMISTIKAVFGAEEEPTGLHVTTPAAQAVQKYLRRMVAAGLTHCILESTSHGLAQHRVTGVNFLIALLTNLTHEHLDYHHTFEAYKAAKMRLFELVASHPDGIAILNRDDPAYADFAAIGAAQQLSYGLARSDLERGNRPAVSASRIEYTPQSTRFQMRLQLDPADRPQEIELNTALVGRFNVYNLLCAAAAGAALGLEPDQIKRGLESVKTISGRMERIDEGQPFITLVDFAHTPDALQKAINAARSMLIGSDTTIDGEPTGRIITVFGSAGKRDVEKRRLMAEISARDADLTILTAEDPRTESLDEILEMMAHSCRTVGAVEGERFWRVPDRGRAIYFGAELARPADILLICGKGHEQSLCFGSTEYPWDDRHATRVALRHLLRQEPMSDLGLPTWDETKL